MGLNKSEQKTKTLKINRAKLFKWMKILYSENLKWNQIMEIKKIFTKCENNTEEALG